MCGRLTGVAARHRLRAVIADEQNFFRRHQQSTAPLLERNHRLRMKTYVVAIDVAKCTDLLHLSGCRPGEDRETRTGIVVVGLASGDEISVVRRGPRDIPDASPAEME